MRPPLLLQIYADAVLWSMMWFPPIPLLVSLTAPAPAAALAAASARVFLLNCEARRLLLCSCDSPVRRFILPLCMRLLLPVLATSSLYVLLLLLLLFSGEGLEPTFLRYSYYTAGSGGAGPTILETSFLLAGETCTVYKENLSYELPPISNRRVVDFGPGEQQGGAPCGGAGWGRVNAFSGL